MIPIRRFWVGGPRAPHHTAGRRPLRCRPPRLDVLEVRLVPSTAGLADPVVSPGVTAADVTVQPGCDGDRPGATDQWWTASLDAYLSDLGPALTPALAATFDGGPPPRDDAPTVAASSSAALAAAIAWAAWEFRTGRVGRSRPETRDRLRFAPTVRTDRPSFRWN